jgi:hypothetical protein
MSRRRRNRRDEISEALFWWAVGIIGLIVFWSAAGVWG